MEEREGYVEHIRFHSPDTGFTVLSISGEKPGACKIPSDLSLDPLTVCTCFSECERLAAAKDGIKTACECLLNLLVDKNIVLAEDISSLGVADDDVRNTCSRPLCAASR